MDKAIAWVFNNFGKLWIGAAVLGLGITGVIVWGFIMLVLHFT